MEKLKFVLYRNEKDDERVLFPDYDIDYYVDETKDGKKYFPVINLYTIEKGNKLSAIFNDRIEDIIKTIKDGNADCVIRRNILFTNSLSAIRFVDREYGEEMRRKTLEGFKDSKFVYKIRIIVPEFNKIYIGENKSIVDMEHALEFNSEEEAQRYIDNEDLSSIEDYIEPENEKLQLIVCQDIKRK